MSTSRSAFDEFVERFSLLVWVLTAGNRRSLFHGGASCWQPAPVLDSSSGALVGERLCHACGEFHHRLMTKLSGEIASRPPGDDLEAWVRRRIFGHGVADTLDAWDGERDLTQRVTRMVERQWVVRLMPDPLDRKLLADVLFFVRRWDALEATPLPFRRIARRHGLTEHDVARRVHAAIECLCADRPAWVERNIDRPLAERLAGAVVATHDDDGVLGWGTPTHTDPDGDDLLEQWAVADVIRRAGARVADGEDADRVLAAELDRAFGTGAAGRVREREPDVWRLVVDQLAAKPRPRTAATAVAVMR